MATMIKQQTSSSLSASGGRVSYPPFSPNTATPKLHTHEMCEIYCVFRGNGHYVTEGTQHKLEPGKILLMRPGEAHKVYLTGNEPYERLAHHFPMSVVDGVDPERRLLAPFFDRPLGLHNVYERSAVAKTKIYDLFSTMYNQKEDDYATELNTTVVLLAVLAELRTLFDHKLYLPPDDNSAKMHAVLEYINENLTRELSVEQVCTRFFLSRGQLNRGFKKATGTTLWDYVMTKRLVLAKMYIADGMHTGQASAACGFRDYSAFYRAYLKKYGVPPSVSDAPL